MNDALPGANESWVTAKGLTEERLREALSEAKWVRFRTSDEPWSLWHEVEDTLSWAPASAVCRAEAMGSPIKQRTNAVPENDERCPRCVAMATLRAHR